MRFHLCLIFVIALVAGPASAKDDTVVFIQCTKDGQTSQGSGVLVSAKGIVLTAKHVIPEGASCQASIGNNSKEARGIRPSFETRQISDGFDAILMEFGRDNDEPFSFAEVCPVTDELNGRDIIAKGFHANSFGAPSATDGILSSTAIDFNGMVETTAMTVNGKSGGPVFLKGTDTVVGIIAGAEFTPQGVVSTYQVLSINALIDDVSLLTKAALCGGPVPKVEGSWLNHSDLTLARADIERGTARLVRGSYRSALEDFNKAYDLGSKFIAPLGRGHAYRGQNLLEQAINEYSLAIREEPGLYLGYIFRGNAYSAQRRFQQAVEDYSKVIALQPEHSAAYNNRGVINALLSYFDRASEDFAEALLLDENNAEYVHNSRAVQLIANGAASRNSVITVECGAPDRC